ncbi:hypothetical protein [Bradyrhizobium sp.]|jgi:precorrin-6B methylase 1
MKYKQLAEEREKELIERANVIESLKEQLAFVQSNLIEQASRDLDSEEAKEILRMFAARANNRDEIVLLVRALAKIPA